MSKPHTQRLAYLRQRGWICPHPEFRHAPTDLDGNPRKAVMLHGTLWGEQRDIFLDVEDGLVMLTVDKRDVCFEEFLRWLDLPGDPAEVKLSDRQKSLFGEGD